MSIVGDKLKLKRIELGMSIAKLSNISKVGKSTISEIETGVAKKPRGDTILALAKALNINMNYLYNINIKENHNSDNNSNLISLELNQVIKNSQLNEGDLKKIIDYIKFIKFQKRNLK